MPAQSSREGPNTPRGRQMVRGMFAAAVVAFCALLTTAVGRAGTRSAETSLILSLKALGSRHRVLDCRDLDQSLLLFTDRPTRG